MLQNEKKFNIYEIIKMNKIKNIISSVIFGLNDICAKHKEKHQYYCYDCDIDICPTCLNSEHNNNHLHFNINEKKSEKISQLLSSRQNIDKYLQILEKFLPSIINDKINELTKQEREQVAFFEELMISLKRRYNEFITELTKLKDITINDQLKDLYDKKNQIRNYVYNEINHIDSLTSRNEIVLFTIKDISKSINEYKNTNNLVNCAISSFQVKLSTYKMHFELENFKKVFEENKDNDDFKLVSPIYKVNFLSWRLVIFPKRKNDDNKETFQIFVEVLENNDLDNFSIEYKFEMENKDKNDNHISSFIQLLEKNKYIGDSNFYQTTKIFNDGFINENGSIIINCYVKPFGIEDFQKELNYYFLSHYNKL